MRRALWAGGLLMLGLMIAQCGSDDSGAAGTPSAGGTAGTAGAAGTSGTAGKGGTAGSSGTGGTAGASGGSGGTAGSAQGGTAGQAGTAQGGTAGQAGSQGGAAGTAGTAQGGTAGQAGSQGGAAGTAGTAGAGGGTTGDFSCVGSVTWPAPTATTVNLQLQVRDYTTNTGVAGLSVSACKKTDTTCTTPEDTDTTDATGNVTLTVGTAAEGVDAYFLITGANFSPTIAYIFVRNTAVFSSNPSFYLLVPPAALVTQMAGVLGVTLDANRGNIVFQATDCAETAANGISVASSTADASSTTAYMIGIAPSSTATQTDSSGAGAILNVPAGATNLSGTVASTSVKYGTVSVLVRAGHLTTTNVVPTPN